MAHINTIPPEDAKGALKDEYDAAIKRAGKIFNIVSIQSLNPRSLAASMQLYKATMHAPMGITRAEREMMATVVSRTNDCFY